MKRKFKQILAALLVVVMLVGIAPISGLMCPEANALDSNVLKYNTKYISSNESLMEEYKPYAIFYEDGSFVFWENMLEGFGYCLGTYEISGSKITVKVSDINFSNNSIKEIIFTISDTGLILQTNLYTSRVGRSFISSENTKYNRFNVLNFGRYPQSKVTDISLILKLKLAGSKYQWNDYNYYAGTGWSDSNMKTLADGNMKPVTNMMRYKDILYDGDMYRAVEINQYRPFFTGDTSSNSQQDDNGYNTGNIYYFKYEPLTWRVLDPDEGYVICTKAIDSQAYQNFIYYNGSEYYNSKDCTAYASDWVTSSLRQWLNYDFYNTAFTDEEKAQIGTSHLENKSTYSSSYDSAGTNDKIFTISYEDAINNMYGFNPDAYANDKTRQLKGTDYACCQGLSVCNDKDYTNIITWWLRSPFQSAAACIGDMDGCATHSYSYFYGYAGITYTGVVPAFKFNPKSTITEQSDEDKIFHENSYIADIWLSRNREETAESDFIKSMLGYDSVSAAIYDDYKNNRDFQLASNTWKGMKVVFDPEKGIEDIYLSEEGLYETLIFDLVKKIMYGQNEDTGNVIIDAANKTDSTVSKITKYKGYIDKISTIVTEPEKNLLTILKDWKFNPQSTSFSKFYGMLNDVDQASSKWTDNKFIEGIGTIADISSDVAEFYKRFTSYIMLEDMSEETVALLKALKEQTKNEAFKKALGNAINAYNDIDTVSVVCTMKLAQDTALDVGGAAFDDLAKCSRVYSTLRAGYKVGVALCDITMNTSKTIDAYKICGATKEFINANKSAINVLANKYLTSRNDFDAGVYVNAIRAYQYAFEIDMENGVEFVKKANDEGLVNKAKKLTVHAVNFFLNTDNKTSYENLIESQETILNSMEMNFSTLNNTWKFSEEYLRSDYPDIYPIYVKEEISQNQYAPNITSAYIEKSGKTSITWSMPFYFKDNDGKVCVLYGNGTLNGIYAAETVGGSKSIYDEDISTGTGTIEFYNESKFETFNKDSYKFHLGLVIVFPFGII